MAFNPKKGLKLLTKMGWKGEGHGLGKSQQGITKPIEVDVRRMRSGFGTCQHVTYDFMEELKELDNKTDAAVPTQTYNKPRVVNMQQLTKQTRRAFINNIQKLLKNFIASITEEDLVFEKSLTSEERALVHKEAHRFGLKTNSQGSGDNRFLVVNKKRTSDELIEQIKKHGRFNKYEMVS